MNKTKLTRDDILKLARLSRLQLSEQEVSQFETEISAILDYVQQLQQVDLTGLEPTNQVTGLRDVMRPDEPINYGPSPDKLLQNAPATENGHFKVKRMIG